MVHYLVRTWYSEPYGTLSILIIDLVKCNLKQALLSIFQFESQTFPKDNMTTTQFLYHSTLVFRSPMVQSMLH